MVIPKEQTSSCAPLPKFEDRDYTDAELKVVLNAWISVHEKCAAKQRVLSAFVIKMYEKPVK